jgi:4-amino-4-deoxy-L-arabinose transferase-like glycosyltransferase
LTQVQRRRGVAVAIVLVVAFLCRLALVLFVAGRPERYIQADAIEYDALAVNLVQGHGFSLSSAAPYAPEVFRTPGYPAFVATIYYALAGYAPGAVLIVQIVISTATCGLVYVLGRILARHEVGVIAATFFALAPVSIIYTAELWSETLFTALLTLGVVLLLGRHSVRRFGLAGLVLGLATLVHPRTLYLTAVLLVVMWCTRTRSRSVLAALFAGFVLAVLPWYVRNNLEFGEITFTSAQGTNLLLYSAALLDVDMNGGSQWDIAQAYQQEARARLGSSQPNDAQLARMETALALEKIGVHPLRYAWVHLKGTARLLAPNTFVVAQLLDGSGQDTQDIYSVFIGRAGTEALESLFTSVGGGTLLLIGLDAAMLAILVTTAAHAAWRARRSNWMWLLLATIGYLALVAGPAAGPRFRLALMPELSVLAAVTVATLPSFLEHCRAAIRQVPSLRHPRRKGDPASSWLERQESTR